MERIKEYQARKYARCQSTQSELMNWQNYYTGTMRPVCASPLSYLDPESACKSQVEFAKDTGQLDE